MAEKTVDAIHREMFAPPIAPFGPVIALDAENKLANRLRQAAHPLVMFVGVIAGGSEQLDYRSERPFEAEDRPVRAAVRAAIAIDTRVILLEYGRHLVHVARIVSDEDRSLQQKIGDGFGNLALAASGNGGGLVTESSIRARADQPPGRAGELLFQAQPVAGR